MSEQPDVTITFTVKASEAERILQTSGFEWRDANGELCEGWSPLSVRETYRKLTTAVREATA